MSFQQIRNATLSARNRTGDNAIGTCVKNGKFKIVRVTYPKGSTSNVESLSDFLPISECVAKLDMMK